MSGNGNKVLLATTNKCSTNSAANFADDERNHLQQSESDNFEVFDYNFASHFDVHSRLIPNALRSFLKNFVNNNITTNCFSNEKQTTTVDIPNSVEINEETDEDENVLDILPTSYYDFEANVLSSQKESNLIIGTPTPIDFSSTQIDFSSVETSLIIRDDQQPQHYHHHNASDNGSNLTQHPLLNIMDSPLDADDLEVAMINESYEACEQGKIEKIELEEFDVASFDCGNAKPWFIDMKSIEDDNSIIVGHDRLPYTFEIGNNSNTKNSDKTGLLENGRENIMEKNEGQILLRGKNLLKSFSNFTSLWRPEQLNLSDFSNGYDSCPINMASFDFEQIIVDKNSFRDSHESLVHHSIQSNSIDSPVTNEQSDWDFQFNEVSDLSATQAIPIDYQSAAMVSSSAEERMDATAALCENLVESLFGGSGKFERDSPSFESMKGGNYESNYFQVMANGFTGEAKNSDINELFLPTCDDSAEPTTDKIAVAIVLSEEDGKVKNLLDNQDEVDGNDKSECDAVKDSTFLELPGLSKNQNDLLLDHISDSPYEETKNLKNIEKKISLMHSKTIDEDFRQIFDDQNKECGSGTVDSWEDLINDEYDSKLDEEIEQAMDRIKIQKPLVDRTIGEEWDAWKNIDLPTHVLEAYSIPRRTTLEDLRDELAKIGCADVSLHKVDDAHCLVVFSCENAALKAMLAANQLHSNKWLRLRKMANASLVSQNVARSSASRLRPHKLRPRTTPFVARRLVEGVLGKRSNVSEHQLKAELSSLKQAKEEKNAQAALWMDHP